MSVESIERRTEAQLAQGRRDLEAGLHKVVGAARIEVAEAERIRHVEAAFKRLDLRYVFEQAEVIRDAALDLAHGKQPAHIVAFLERSLWASTDALARAADEAGLTKAALDAAVHASLRLDRPELMAVEYDIMLTFLGIGPEEAERIGLGRGEIESLLKEAQQERAEFDIGEVTNLYAVTATACCRPERIAAAAPALAIHLWLKQIALAILLAANIVAIAVPGGALAGVVSFAAVAVMAARGC